jgi:hypothetical protein
MKNQMKIMAACMAVVTILLASSLVFAGGDLKGTFTGKVMCQAGKKKAEFKTDSLIVSFYSMQEVKKRIDELTWPGPKETTSFSVREKEKIQLQHAVKLLRDLSCDAVAPAAPPEAFPVKPAPSDVTPKPKPPPMQFIQ